MTTRGKIEARLIALMASFGSHVVRDEDALYRTHVLSERIAYLVAQGPPAPITNTPEEDRINAGVPVSAPVADMFGHRSW